MDYPLREQSRDLCRVGLGFEEPLDDDVATEDEMARVDSDIESSGDNEKDSEMGKHYTTMPVQPAAQRTATHARDAGYVLKPAMRRGTLAFAMPCAARQECPAASQ
ncbi:hypothetical protein HAX54_026590 [Datura stramonium]|uniref:Uncharacterized protein n=1 Tax=Datura stramonium TaxID=4076 RepID=A0ABS8V2H4_DATST|nr:hypothetical protein [Datura stramonium]